jgi:hypothetical protein
MVVYDEPTVANHEKWRNFPSLLVMLIQDQLKRTNENFH